MPAPIHPDIVKKFDGMLALGHTVASARRECGVSQAWAYDRSKGRKRRDQAKYYAALNDDDQVKPKVASKLKPEAQHALECFKCFRLRYTGRSSVPWQIDAASQMVALLESPDKEYVVVNAPPGGGKSTLFTHDIPLWLICRNRAIRILIGSATQRQATLYTNRLRRSLQATKPHMANDDELARGMVDAVAAVAIDFGRFKPDSQNPDVWRAEEFSVAQVNNVSAADKEHTVTAFGKEGGVLGNRVDFCIWDDLIDERNLRTVEAREEIKRWWKSTAETRIDPRGVMVLQGQRMGTDDLYRFALDMKSIVLDEEGFEDPEAEPPAKYKHIVYRAHYEDRCDGRHPRRMEPWPASCLLDPHNLPWIELARQMKNGPDEFKVLFQQEDADVAGVLVDKLWVTGGHGPHGEVYFGCWDKERGSWELPELPGEVFVYATVDPSPTKYWGLQVWAYHPTSERYFLLDLVRQRMQMSDFLDWDPDTGDLRGLAVQWQVLSERLGHRISTWVVERNAAQQFFFSYAHTERFKQRYSIELVAHQTGQNKNDPKYGVHALRPLYRDGRIRLPGKGEDARLASLKLVDEVTKWPHGTTDDQVMSQWFGVWSLPRIYSPANIAAPQFKRPGWATGRNLQAVS